MSNSLYLDHSTDNPGIRNVRVRNFGLRLRRYASLSPAEPVNASFLGRKGGLTERGSPEPSATQGTEEDVCLQAKPIRATRRRQSRTRRFHSASLSLERGYAAAEAQNITVPFGGATNWTWYPS